MQPLADPAEGRHVTKQRQACRVLSQRTGISPWRRVDLRPPSRPYRIAVLPLSPRSVNLFAGATCTPDDLTRLLATLFINPYDSARPSKYIDVDKRPSFETGHDVRFSL